MTGTRARRTLYPKIVLSPSKHAPANSLQTATASDTIARTVDTSRVSATFPLRKELLLLSDILDILKKYIIKKGFYFSEVYCF